MCCSLSLEMLFKAVTEAFLNDSCKYKPDDGKEVVIMVYMSIVRGQNTKFSFFAMKNAFS